MKTFNFLILLGLFLVFPITSQALFHFEPGIGYNRGHRQAQRAQGIGLTTKLGLEFTSFFVLADLGYHNLQIASTPTSTATDMGLCLGGDFKTWRFWFTYLASANLKTEAAGVTSEYDGDGFKLGLSGRLSNKAYMNLEIRFIDIKELDGTPVTQLMDVALLSVSWKLF